MERGVVVGQLDHWDEPVCINCRAVDLDHGTTLTAEEAVIKAAHQLTDLSFDGVADVLGVDESTVETKLRVVQKRIKKDQLTHKELMIENRR